MISTLQIQLYFCSLDLYTNNNSDNFYLSSKVFNLKAHKKQKRQLIPIQRIHSSSNESTFCSSIQVQDMPSHQNTHSEMIAFQVKIPNTQKLSLQIVSILKSRKERQKLSQVDYIHSLNSLNSRVALKIKMATKNKMFQMNIVLKTMVIDIQCKLISQEQTLIRILEQSIRFLLNQTKQTESFHQQNKGLGLINSDNSSSIINKKCDKIQIVSGEVLAQLKQKIMNYVQQVHNQFLLLPSKYFAKILQMTRFSSCYNQIFYKVSSSVQQCSYSRQDLIAVNCSSIRQKGYHLIIFVHGLNGSSHDLRLIKEALSQKIASVKKLYMFSKTNENKTEIDLEIQGKNLAKQIDKFILNSHPNIQYISFVGHSLGGLIVRAALPFLCKYAHKMHTYVSLSTPHFGFVQNSLLSLGLKLIGNSSKSIDQLLFRDQNQVEECYMFKLASFEGLNWFRIVVIFSSKQDKYVPYQSSQASGNSSNELINKMFKNMFKNMQAQRIVRTSVQFKILQKSLDDFIGRTAHLKFLQDPQFIDKFGFIMNDLWES